MRAAKRPLPLPVITIVLAYLAIQFLPVVCGAQTKNGFDLSNALVPADEILPGGPPRDGIPAIEEPVFTPLAGAGWLTDDDRILGIYRNGVAKAYPISIMNWHEIVNDRVAGEPLAITFCPLCGTGMAFNATLDGKASLFGVSGLLYNSDVLLYDRDTESLWSQIARKAISGPRKGARLEMVPLAHTRWKDWKTTYPDTLVLSRDTGHGRDYSRNPYAGYETSQTVLFPLANVDRRYHPKEQVIGLELDGRFKAYPFLELSKTPGPIQDRVGNRRVEIRYDAEHRTGKVLDINGDEIPTVIAFWFAWSAFHPDTQVYTASP
jgi:hypothetical protein